MSFVKIDKTFDPKVNFWELNPQMIIISPYSKLYARDKSPNKVNSSKEMWICFLMCDPDEDINILFRIDLDKRRETIKENYYSQIDWNDELFNQCLTAYPNDCLTAVEKSLKDTKEYILSRAQMLKEIVKDKKAYMANMSKIDTAISKNDKIYKDYAAIEQEFMKAKSSDAEVYGGRRETKQEKGLI